MVEVETDNTHATIRILGSHRLLALKRRIELPLAHISGVRLAPEAIGTDGRKGLKLVGGRVGGRIVGTFRQDGDTVFWDATDPQKTIRIDTRDEHFARIFVDVADPAATVDRLSAAIDAASGAQASSA